MKAKYVWDETTKLGYGAKELWKHRDLRMKWFDDIWEFWRKLESLRPVQICSACAKPAAPPLVRCHWHAAMLLPSLYRVASWVVYRSDTRSLSCAADRYSKLTIIVSPYTQDWRSMCTSEALRTSTGVKWPCAKLNHRQLIRRWVNHHKTPMGNLQRNRQAPSTVFHYRSTNRHHRLPMCY